MAAIYRLVGQWSRRGFDDVVAAAPKRLGLAVSVRRPGRRPGPLGFRAAGDVGTGAGRAGQGGQRRRSGLRPVPRDAEGAGRNAGKGVDIERVRRKRWQRSQQSAASAGAPAAAGAPELWQRRGRSARWCPPRPLEPLLERVGGAASDAPQSQPVRPRSDEPVGRSPATGSDAHPAARLQSDRSLLAALVGRQQFRPQQSAGSCARRRQRAGLARLEQDAALHEFQRSRVGQRHRRVQSAVGARTTPLRRNGVGAGRHGPRYGARQRQQHGLRRPRSEHLARQPHVDRCETAPRSRSFRFPLLRFRIPQTFVCDHSARSYPSLSPRHVVQSSFIAELLLQTTVETRFH